MRIEYEITEQDFLNGQRLAIRHSPIVMVRLTRWVFPVFGFVMLVVLVSALLQQGFFLGLIPGLVFCGLFISLPLLSKRTQKKLYKNTPSIHGKLSLEADENGLAFESPTVSSKIAWANFWKAFEDERSFVIYQQNRQIFNIIPKRGLSPQEVTELRNCLARNLSSQS